MYLFRNKDKSAAMTLPEARIVHGVEVRKVPIQQYITALQQLESLPKLLIEECFPGKKAAEALASLLSFNPEDFVGLLGRILVVAPSNMVDALCLMLGLEAETIKNEKTPNEFKDIVKAYWELNDMTDFFVDVWGLIKKKLLPTLNGGSSAGSP